MIQNKAPSWLTAVILLLLAPILAAQATVNLVQSFNLDAVENLIGPTDVTAEIDPYEISSVSLSMCAFC